MGAKTKTREKKMERKGRAAKEKRSVTKLENDIRERTQRRATVL